MDRFQSLRCLLKGVNKTVQSIMLKLGMYGYVWIYIGIFGYVWVYLGMYGYVQVCMGIYGYKDLSKILIKGYNGPIIQNQGNFPLLWINTVCHNTV